MSTVKTRPLGYYPGSLLGHPQRSHNYFWVVRVGIGRGYPTYLKSKTKAWSADNCRCD